MRRLEFTAIRELPEVGMAIWVITPAGDMRQGQVAKGQWGLYFEEFTTRRRCSLNAFDGVWFLVEDLANMIKDHSNVSDPVLPMEGEL